MFFFSVGHRRVLDANSGSFSEVCSCWEEEQHQSDISSKLLWPKSQQAEEVKCHHVKFWTPCFCPDPDPTGTKVLHDAQQQRKSSTGVNWQHVSWDQSQHRLKIWWSGSHFVNNAVKFFFSQRNWKNIYIFLRNILASVQRFESVVF